MRHANVAVFLPHGGCENRCSYCNQHAAAGNVIPPGPDEVRQLLKRGMGSLGEKTRSAEIAFFGGSFTALPKKERLAYLDAARPFLGEDGYSGIRISTRPDCIDDAILDELVDHGVTAIELGAESMNDAVLAANNRGHTAAEVAAASEKIKARGFSLGLHMMTGLYASTPETDRQTAFALAGLYPDTMRIHPTIVLEGTVLARLYREGRYRPQTLDEAVDACAELLLLFQEHGVNVIRLGLHDEASLRESLVAGPHHPAFRELVEGKILLDRAFAAIQADRIPPGPISLRVHPSCISRMAGQQRRNLAKLAEKGYQGKIIGDSGIPRFWVNCGTK